MLKRIEIDLDANKGTAYYRLLWWQWQRPFRRYKVDWGTGIIKIDAPIGTQVLVTYTSGGTGG